VSNKYNKIVIICGPTASGKTTLGVVLAQKWGAEIISADSGQLYRGLDIGTAKPTLEEQAQVSFHLIDILNPDQIFSAADFKNLAGRAIQDIQSRKKLPLIVGGTGLYLKALEGGLFEGPSRDPRIREELEKKIEKNGAASLHEELRQVDPEAAQGISPQNRQRLIRALEVYYLTGEPISSLWKRHRFQDRPYSLTLIKVGLSLPRDEMYLRVEKRVDHMFDLGLAKEAMGLLEKWGPEIPAFKLIGYRELLRYFQHQLSLEEAVILIKKNTRHYVKRQLTWFKKDKEIHWIRNQGELESYLTK